MCYSLSCLDVLLFFFFFFNDTATTEIYTLSLHDALPIYVVVLNFGQVIAQGTPAVVQADPERSEEHTSELQSPCNLVCRLLLEKKKNTHRPTYLPPPCHRSLSLLLPHVRMPCCALLTSLL